MPSADNAITDQEARIKALEAWRIKHSPHEIGPALDELFGNFRLLPGLRGLWYPGSADNTGAVYDASNQGRTLTYNGNPALNAYNNGMISYYALDGTGDYFSRADEAGLDILGTEAYVAPVVRGLTVGGWFTPNSLTGTQMLMSKRTAAGNQRAWGIWLSGSGPVGGVSVDGINEPLVAGTVSAVIGQALFSVLRFQTSNSEMALFTNGVKATAAGPASIFNSTAALQIGASDGGVNLFTGNWFMSFLCASALSDQLLRLLFNRTRVFFNV